MKVERMIRLDEPLERRIITDARRSVSIAFEPDNVEAKQRLLGGLANGDVVSEKRVGEAIDLLLEVRLAISEDIKHYERLRDDPPPMERLPRARSP